VEGEGESRCEMPFYFLMGLNTAVLQVKEEVSKQQSQQHSNEAARRK
jgi:hypothetical protein